MKIYLIKYNDNYPGEWGATWNVVRVVKEKPNDEQMKMFIHQREKEGLYMGNEEWRYEVEEIELEQRLPKWFGSGEFMLLQPWVRNVKHVKGDTLFDVDLGEMEHNGKKWV